MRKRYCAVFIVILMYLFVIPVYAGTIPTITDDVSTDFGTYRPVTVTVTPAVPPYYINGDLSNVVNIGDFELSQKAQELLKANGFTAVAGRYRQIYDIYNENKDRGIPVFVTTDACLHTYHILYDYVLRVVEMEYFYRDLTDLTRTLLTGMQGEYDEATEPTVREAALDNIAYLSVAMKLLDPEAEVDERVADVVGQEIDLIMQLSAGYVPSPLFYTDDYPYLEDYSQYKPRGHYTRSEMFERYFRAMMWYGRITFSLNLPYATEAGIRHAAIQALLLSKSIDTSFVENDTDRPVSEFWRRIYDPTVFFVGKADDINYDAYLYVAIDNFGRSFTRLRPDALADTEKLDAFIADALELPDPKITVKAGKGFRLMGQRFIPDSYVLDQLVEEFVSNRLMPRGLDVMAALGSERAYDIVSTLYKDPELYPDYDPQLTKMKNELSGYTPETWAQNLYFNWLYSLVPLLDTKGEGYPMFMQNEAWTDKALDTALGSWAELRHDTILYAKQSETLETSMPPDPQLVRGYVEPEPEVYARLAALAAFTRAGLESRGLLNDLFGSRLDEFERLMLSLTTIAVKELENRTPTDAENALLCNFGPKIEELTSFPSEYSQYRNEADDFMAVIADVHTDPNLNQALEVGVGHPLVIYVIAPVNGTPTLVRGGIFSYHEFKRSLAEGRLTDEEWQKLQSGPNAVSMPEWTESFIAGPSSNGEETFHFSSHTREVTSVEDDEVSAPESFATITAFPNPFNPSTTIDYNLAESGHVRLSVYSLTGQLVGTLVDEWCEAGLHSVRWMPVGLASGMYIVKIRSGETYEAVRVTLVK